MTVAQLAWLGRFRPLRRRETRSGFAISCETSWQFASDKSLPNYVSLKFDGLVSRAGEVRVLRLRDLRLTWDREQITSAEDIVPKSKTAAGTGRLIPLSRRVCASLSLWVGYFPNVTPDSYLFPFFQVGIGGDSRAVTMYDLDLTRPMGSWRKAWLEACKRIGVRYRWHDLRHSFVTRLAERPDVSEQTIRALAGHVSNQMLQQYSHIRSQAKQAAIRTLEEQEIEPTLPQHGQRIGHSGGHRGEAVDANSLKENGGPARI